MHPGFSLFARLAVRAGLVMSAAFLVAVGITSPSFAQDEDLDDLMGGFDDDFDSSEFEEEEDVAPEWFAELPGGSWAYENVDISGSIAAGATRLITNFFDTTNTFYTVIFWSVVTGHMLIEIYQWTGL